MAERVKVNPNRMELLKLKRRLSIARRGHRLLKEKLDELMKPFLAALKEIKGMQSAVEGELQEAYQAFTLARSGMSPVQLEEALSHPGSIASVAVEFVPVVSVIAPSLALQVEGEFDCYGLASTPASLDEAIGRFHVLLSRMLELAQKEKTIQLLAAEIEKTRRRVNALEYVLIPQLEETIHFITMKLDEFERSNLTRLMKIKEMVG
jgi:V/A-type H+/Na+-transporting ATPase subunit D